MQYHVSIKTERFLFLILTQAIKEEGIDIDGFLTVGVSAALRQLLEFGLFHGDPHPGNIFAMRDGRIAYVDFGNVAELSQVSLFSFFPQIYSEEWFWDIGWAHIPYSQLYIAGAIKKKTLLGCHSLPVLSHIVE